MTNWHYNNNGAQQGPIPIDELKAKIATGELTGTSLVWQVGTKDWNEIRNCPELVGQVQTPPPLPKSVTVVAGTRTAMTAFVDSLPVLIPLLSILLIAVALVLPMEASPRYKEYKVGEWFGIASAAFIAVAIALAFLLQPKISVSPPSFAWKRCFAKVLDWGLAALAGSIAVAFIGPTTWQSFLFVFVGVYLAVWFLFEVPMKCNSLGRRVFGIRVQGATSANYFLRFVKLSIVGLGCWIPFLSTLAMLLAYKRLRETGTTIWDGNDFTVVDEHAGVGRVVFGVLLIGILLGVQGTVLKSAGKAAEMSRSSENISSSPISAASSHPDPNLPTKQTMPVVTAVEAANVEQIPNTNPKKYRYSFTHDGHTYKFDTTDVLTPEQVAEEQQLIISDYQAKQRAAVASASPQNIAPKALPKPTTKSRKLGTYSFPYDGGTLEFQAPEGLSDVAIAAYQQQVISQYQEQKAGAMSPVKQSSWATLTPQQREVLAPLSGEWNNLDSYRRKKWLEIVQRYPTMTVDEQQRVQLRMKDWANLSPEEREQAREQYRMQKKD